MEVNKEVAARYYKLVAENRYTFSMNFYTTMNYQGNGIAVNKVEAAKYFKMSADKGVPGAMEGYAFLLTKGEGVEKNKQEAAISETTNKSEIADRSTNKSIVIGENINKSAISNENINKSTVVDENQKQETKKEINNYSKEIKTQKNNDNSSVQKSKQENYDDQERRSFVLPNLPFSMNPIHFSFEASMKYDDSLKTPQFKALPIPTFDASNNSNDLKKTLQNSEESAAIRMSELKKAKTIELHTKLIGHSFARAAILEALHTYLY